MTTMEKVLRALFVGILLAEIPIVDATVMKIRGDRMPENFFQQSSSSPTQQRSSRDAPPQTTYNSLALSDSQVLENWANSRSNTITVATKIIVLTEQWSEPPVIREPSQGLDAYIWSGEAASIESRDADHPEVIYTITLTNILITGGDSHRRPIDKFQWRALGIKRSPVQLKYVIYTSK